MRTQGTAYGCYTRVNNFRYNVFFHNPITKERPCRVAESEDEAKKILNDFNFDFFSKYSFMLPRGISVNRKIRKFVFCVNIRNKMIFIYHDYDLDKVVEAKHEFINNLI